METVPRMGSISISVTAIEHIPVKDVNHL